MVGFLKYLVFIPVLLSAQSDLKGEATLTGIQAWSDSYRSQSQVGIRYIPTWSYRHFGNSGNLADLEIAGKINTSWNSEAGTDEILTDFYRFWLRYSTERFEARLGLQKITFGPAKLFRPLQWFDTIDPRDPQQLTKGVNAVRIRSTYDDNAELILWSTVNKKIVESHFDEYSDCLDPGYGGRLSLPSIYGSEISFTVHHQDMTLEGNNLPTRLGLDYYIEYGPALWIELMKGWVENSYKGIELTLGSDYTFGVGNGITITSEYSWVEYRNARTTIDESGNIWEQYNYKYNLYGLMANYPLNMTDMLSIIGIYYPEEEITYHYFNWQRAWDNWLLQAGAFLLTGADSFSLGSTMNAIGTKGFQINLIFNH